MFKVDGNSAEIDIDEDGQRFLDVVERYGHSKGYIDAYDQALTRISEIIEQSILNLKSFRVSFRDTTYTVPDRLPSYYREAGETYGVNLSTTAVIIDGDDNETEVKLNLGKIPIMMGSIYDIVDYNNAIKDGECPDDPKSYFIFEGNEKVFNGLENLAVNRIMMRSIGDPSVISNNMVSITTESKLGKTSVITVYADKDYIVRFNNFRDFADKTARGSNNLNVLIMFWIFEEEVIIENLLEYTRPEWRNKVETYLIATIEDFRELNEISILKHIHAINETNVDLRIDMGNTAPSVRRKYMEMYKDKISEGLYSHIPITDTKRKLALLSLQTVQCIEYVLNLKEKTDLNAYRNKRIKTPGPAIFHLFGLYWEMAVEKITNDSYQSVSDLVKVLSNEIQSKNIENHLQYSFSRVWGLQGSRNMKNSKPFEQYKSNYYVSRHKHINKLVRVRNARSQNFDIRAIQTDQTGYVDEFETPESSKNGLNNTKAISCRISLFRDDATIISLLKENSDIVAFDKFTRTDSYDTFFMIGGIIMGICNGKRTHKLLRTHKRNNMLPFDIGIYYEVGHIIIIANDAGRLVRPLLTVNTDSGNLSIDDEHITSTKVTELMSRGAIEFLDAMETVEIDVCESTTILRELRQQVKILTRRIKLYNTYLKDSTRTYHRDIDEHYIIHTNDEYNKIWDARHAQYSVELIVLQNTREGLLTKLANHLKLKNNSDFEDKYNAIYGEISRNDSKIIDVQELIKNLNEHRKTVLDANAITRIIQDISNELTLKDKDGRYDYCEIDPVSQFGVSMSLIPRSNHNPGPRNVFQSKMYNQAQGHYNSAARIRFELTKTLVYANRPIIETETARLLGMPHHTQGATVVLAIMTAGGWNIEDALVFNLASVQRGLGLSIDTRILKENIVIPPITSDTVVSFDIPDKFRTRSINSYGRDIYRNLDERGVIKPGSVLLLGDCVRSIFKVSNGQQSDSSIYIRKSKIGTVTKLIYNTDKSSEHLLILEISLVLMPQPGDKFTPLHAQKSVIGQLRRHEDMPYSIQGGIVPSILINPHAIPSRMTVSMLIEMLVSKAAAFEDKRVNMTAFRPFDVVPYEEVLESYGYEKGGKETLINGKTGHAFEVDIFIAPCYYSRLHHDVEDKYQMRSEGAYKLINNQPVTGRDYDGAMRWGEMERDVLIGHGAAGMIEEIYKLNSNPTKIYACKRCVPNTRVIKTTGGSFYCPTCGNNPDIIVSTSTYAQEMLRNYSLGFGTLMEYDYEEI